MHWRFECMSLKPRQTKTKDPTGKYNIRTGASGKMQIIPVRCRMMNPEIGSKVFISPAGVSQAMNISPSPPLPPPLPLVLMAELWLTLVMGKWIADNYIL